MNKPRMYHTMRARWETAKDLVEKGKTAEADNLNQLTLSEALIEILATLDEIAGTLYILANSFGEPTTAPKTKPTKFDSQSKAQSTDH